MKRSKRKRKRTIILILSLLLSLNLLAKNNEKSEITVSEDGFVTISKAKEKIIKKQKIPEREIVRGEIIDWNVVPEFSFINLSRFFILSSVTTNIYSTFEWNELTAL